MKRVMVVGLLLIVVALMLSNVGCSTCAEAPQHQVMSPQWRPSWVTEGRWDPHWVENEPFRPWPL
jgi:hypothetical protein